MKTPPEKLAHDLKKIATQSEIFAVELTIYFYFSSYKQ